MGIYRAPDNLDWYGSVPLAVYMCLVGPAAGDVELDRRRQEDVAVIRLIESSHSSFTVLPTHS